MNSCKSTQGPSRFSFVLASLLLALPACANEAAKGKDAKDAGDKAGEDKAGEDTPEPIAGKPVEGEGKVGTKAGAEEGDEKQYSLQIDPGEGKVGEEGKVTVRVVPEGAWHMNLEYPTALTVEAPEGVEVAKAKLKKDDAVTLDEKKAEFAVSFTPSEAGDKTFTGEFKFAVCQDEVCSPKTEKLEFRVAVK